jgi:cellulose synthase/poly-beta-1,6-N-acetylglucosamine synthase-like glycosyltransferase
MSKTEVAHEEKAQEQVKPEKELLQVPRPSSCCIFVTVLSILTFAAIAAYLSVWDDSKTFKNWADRFFASERELIRESQQEHSTLVRYDAGQWVFFVLLCIIFVVNLTIIIPALIVVLRRRCRSTTKKVNRMRSIEDKPSVDVIVPCYLPNECEIIEETIWHILQHVESPGALKLWLVYNTPKDMPELEARLRALSDRVDLPHGRTLAVIRAESSRSKAENINLVLPHLTANYTVIYDADHHPDPESLMLLIEKILRRKTACVQGSTYIRDLNSGILARIIDAEFFVTHFVYFPIMRLLTRNAVFCGSNGLWQTDILQGTDFNPRMQTEDIDVSVRMLLERHSIDFCPEARSGELAPVSLQALFKQRLRWAIGWDEVSLQLFQKVTKSDAQGTRKLAVSYVCWSRWFMQVVGLVAGIATPLLGLVQRINPELCHCGMGTQLLQTCMFYFYIILVISCTLESIFQTHHRGCQSWIQVLFVGLFMGVGFFYIVFQAGLIIVSLFKIGTGTVGGWVVTARKAHTPVSKAEKSASGDEEAPVPGVEKSLDPESPADSSQDVSHVVEV